MPMQAMGCSRSETLLSALLCQKISHYAVWIGWEYPSMNVYEFYMFMHLHSCVRFASCYCWWVMQHFYGNLTSKFFDTRWGNCFLSNRMRFLPRCNWMYVGSAQINSFKPAAGSTIYLVLFFIPFLVLLHRLNRPNAARLSNSMDQKSGKSGKSSGNYRKEGKGALLQFFLILIISTISSVFLNHYWFAKKDNFF